MNSSPETKSSAGRWAALIAALLGWMFDGAEMGIFSLVGRPAVKELLNTTDEGQVGLWFNIIMAGFLVGAATGGVLFGWLGDRIGRVRAMTLSVLTYAVFTGLCGCVSSSLHLPYFEFTPAAQVGLLRFIAALGMGGEWSLGVALVMEVWPNKSRAFMAGLIGAAANVGYVLVGFVGLGLNNVVKQLHGGLIGIGLSEPTASFYTANSGWRIMMILGVVPALLTFFIRIFVPESEKWEHEQKSGKTSNWATRDLLAVLVGLLGPVLIVYVWGFPHSVLVRLLGTAVGLVIATVGYMFPVYRYFQRQESAKMLEERNSTLCRMLLAACLSGIALIGTWGSTQQAPSWADKLAEDHLNAEKAALQETYAHTDPDHVAKLQKPHAKEYTLIAISVGAVIGTLLAAWIGDLIGRRPAYFLLCMTSMLSAWMLFLGNKQYDGTMLGWAFVAGVCTASFYGWLPLYLPELFRTNVRATGQGFGFNFGRILASVGVLQVGNLLTWANQSVDLGPLTIPPGRPLACSLICLVYLVGMVLIWFAPETKGKPLPE